MSLADKSIECRYHISSDDYAVLNSALMHIPKKRTRLMYIRMSFLLVFFVILVFALKQISGDSWRDIATGLGSGVVVGGLVVYVFRRYLTRLYGRMLSRMHYKSDIVEKAERTLVFSSEGLFVDAEKFKGEAPWSGFISIMHTEDHFVLWQNSRQAHIVPFRAFADGDVETLWQFFETMPVAKRVRLK